MKLDKRFYREQIPLTLVAAIVGGWTVGVLSRDERRTATAIVAEQSQKIRRLQEIVDADPPPDRPEAMPCETSTTDETPTVSVSDYDKLENNYLNKLSHDCQMSRDWIITRPRYTCREANILVNLAELMEARCDEAIGLIQTPEVKGGLIKSKEILNKMRENPRIYKPQCLPINPNSKK